MEQTRNKSIYVRVTQREKEKITAKQKSNKKEEPRLEKYSVLSVLSIRSRLFI